MKKIYTKENIKKNLIILQNRFSNTCNRKFSIQQVIYAFNNLPGKYQDLLLKINKDENDKILLTYAYDKMKKNLLAAKNIPDDIRIQIKNIHEEEQKKKEEYSLEDIEKGNEDKWVKPVEKKNENSYNEDLNRKKIVISRVPTRKVEKVELKKEEPILKEIKPVEVKVVEEKPVEKKTENNKKEELNNKIKIVVMKEYIKEREKIDIEELLDNLEMDEDDKFIIMVKFENNSVKTNEEVSKELGIKVDYIDNVVNNFYELSIKQKKKKVYKLERE